MILMTTIMILLNITFGGLSMSAFGQLANTTTNTGNTTIPNVVSTLTSLLTTHSSKDPPFTKATTIYMINSTSMSPVLHPGDFLVVENHTFFTDLKIGDIIVFRSPFPLQDTGQRESIVARVMGIYQTMSDGQRILRTKGDANPESIPGIDYPIAEKNYIGKVLFIIPK
jgi:signal peptidase I